MDRQRSRRGSAGEFKSNFALAAALKLTDALQLETIPARYLNLVAVRTADLGKPYVEDIANAYKSPEFKRAIDERFQDLWRPLDVVEQLPLALCDARSIAAGDLVPSDLVYRDKVGETFSFTYNPAHRWHYFPKLRPNEALLFKISDSREDDTARLTAHTAFEDPTTPANAAPRRSIELRALVFWRD